jgi:hypothetical protein
MQRGEAIAALRAFLPAIRRDYGVLRVALFWSTARGERDPREEGLHQLEGYLAGLGLDTGWLVLFDRRPGLPRLGQRTSTERTKTAAGREVGVVRA